LKARITQRAEQPARHGPALGRRPSPANFIAANEAFERISFYGIRSILVVYMVQDLLLAEHDAKATFHFFVFAGCLATLFGAWLAERLAGRYRATLWFSALYVAGYATVALSESRGGLYTGLALLALGSGGVRPCVSALAGDQASGQDRPFLVRVYGLFYWIEKLGSAGLILLLPILRRDQGSRLALALPGALAVLALLVFWLGRRRYLIQPASGQNPNGFLHVSDYAIRRLGTGRLGDHWLDVTRDRFPAAAVVGTKAVYRVLGILATTFTFWALFDQRNSSWVLQASQMDLRVLGQQLDPAQTCALGPILVLLLVPLFSAAPGSSAGGRRTAPLGKMTVGMFLTAFSFAAAAGLQLVLDGGAQPSVLWQLPQHLLLSSGEILVCITGLEFAYREAPASMKGTVLNLWFLSAALGNLLTAWVSLLNALHGWTYFAFFAVVMIAGSFLFRAVARRYRPVEPEGAGLEASQ
jgi:proton-dependent oligopeptide transporter, POT family